MNSDAALDAAHFAVKAALELGATQCEAAVSVSQRFAAEARSQTITKLEQATGKSMQMRVFVEGRKAAFATSDFDRDALRSVARRAVDAAKFVAKDQYAGLPEVALTTAHATRDLAIYAQDVLERSDHAKLQEALELEALIRATDARISNSSGSHTNDSVSLIALVNSQGFSGSYSGTRASRSTAPVAQDGENKRTGHYGSAARSLRELETPQTVADKAVRRTVDLFGAKKPATMRVPVIFERDVAAAVLGDIFTALSGSNVAICNSWAADLMNERVGSDLASIVDDGTIPGALGSSPFDGEGLPTRRTVVFERGMLRSFLLDTYYARKLGLSSTANCGAGGGIAPNTFHLAAGSMTLEELIAKTPRGILIMDTIGFATEYASGTYSRGARGFYIENGELAYPIEEFTVAGTFKEMLAGIDAVANDLIMDSSIVSPSFRVAEMTISGN